MALVGGKIQIRTIYHLRLFLPFLYRWKNEVSVMLLTEFDQKSYDNGLIKVGVEKEKEEERIKNIHNMFTLNLPPEIIAKTCEVSVDYVLDLKKDLENNERR